MKTGLKIVAGIIVWIVACFIIADLIMMHQFIWSHKNFRNEKLQYVCLRGFVGHTENGTSVQNYFLHYPDNDTPCEKGNTGIYFYGERFN